MNGIYANQDLIEKLQDVICFMDYIDIAQGFLWGFLRGDWKGQIKRHGIAGIFREFISATTQYNSPEIRVSRVNTCGADVEKVLTARGVRIYGRLANSREVFFAVERRQYRWAIYILLRSKFNVTSTIPRDVERWAGKHKTPVPARKDKKK